MRTINNTNVYPFAHGEMEIFSELNATIRDALFLS